MIRRARGHLGRQSFKHAACMAIQDGNLLRGRDNYLNPIHLAFNFSPIFFPLSTMPAVTLAGALLTLTEELDPWRHLTWRDHTQLTTSPLEESDDVYDLPPGWTLSIQDSVLDFAEAYWNHSRPQEFIKKQNDEFAAGRDAWNSLVHDSWSRTWGISRRIDDAMAAMDSDAWCIMKNLKVSEVRLCISLSGFA